MHFALTHTVETLGESFAFFTALFTLNALLLIGLGKKDAMHKRIQYSLLRCTTSRARCEKTAQNLHLIIKEGVKS